MKYQIPTHDYELISAYLDNQLSDKDHALIEARLKADPELRKELDEMSKTRMLIRNLPRLRAPRNYFIKAEPVPVRPTLRLAPVFGIVSAVASVLLALVIFGSTFFKSRQPVAMAPASVPMVQETQAIQSEIQRSAISPEVTTEAPPMAMLTAPKQEAPPTETTGMGAGQQATIATPTTIYMFAYPPTATPGGASIMSEEQQETTQLQCQEMYGSWAYPTLTSPYDCPSPTPSFTPTPTYTPSSAQQVEQLEATGSATPTQTPTQTETPTATPSETPTATPTASPTLSPTPVPTEMPPSSEKVLPTDVAAAPSGLSAPNISADTGGPASTAQQQGGTSDTSGSFLSYLLLTVELSLASIAIIAGIIAIIFRIRAGR